MSNIEQRRDKTAEINQSSQTVGQVGEAKFEDSFRYFIPAIAGISEDEARFCKFELVNISEDHLHHDFILREPNGKTHLVEVKTRTPDYQNNAVLETWQYAYTDKHGRYRQSIPGWYVTSKAVYYIFVHYITDKTQSMQTGISADNLKALVNKNGYSMRNIPDGKGYLVPIKDMNQAGGITIFQSNKPPKIEPFTAPDGNEGWRLDLSQSWPEYAGRFIK